MKSFIQFIMVVAGSFLLGSFTLFSPIDDGRQVSFSVSDRENFKSPPSESHPGTLIFFIGGNVSIEGITADLEAIAAAGLSSIQLFHGSGTPWKGVDNQIECLSPSWDEMIAHTARECQRLGLRFSIHNCPGWAMAGGPWIESSNAMRHLAWSRTDVTGGKKIDCRLPISPSAKEKCSDYRDITVLAFPTPLDDTNEPLRPQSIRSNVEFPWEEFLLKDRDVGCWIDQEKGQPHWVEVTFDRPTPLRTVEFSSVRGFYEAWCYDPGVTIRIEAILPDATTKHLLFTEVPQSSWQDDRNFSLALSEILEAKTYRISFTHENPLHISHLKLYSAARKNNWESEAGWTLRGFVRAGEDPVQSPETFVKREQIKDITSCMDDKGQLLWNAPEGNWTILRIGHINNGERNGPAPQEATGWECDKLSTTGADAHFAGFIGRLTAQGAPLSKGLLNEVHLDSWECRTQTWTADMEGKFNQRTGYSLRQWLPAVFGYVVEDHETTARFLLDWRHTIGSLFADEFYGRMAALAHENGMEISCETSAGDIFPADIMEYFKYADIPMCEFWQPAQKSYVGSLNFKPIKPTVSAARLYGKPRVSAESFTSFALTWDEHWVMLRERANKHFAEGVSHIMLHTYTHNPQVGFLPPGTSFGGAIGTPFLRGQTWWKHMPTFTDYLARCTYMLERGNPVSDVLWYLGDEISHKPDQNYPFPEGVKYDYCNPDILMNRLSVIDGYISTPEGIRYSVLWLNDNKRMLLETLEKLCSLVEAGATIVGEAPEGIASLKGGSDVQARFDMTVRHLWGETDEQGIRSVGQGRVISGLSLEEALHALEMKPDFLYGGESMWMHRQTEGADWYFVCAPEGKGFEGKVSFRNTGHVEIWEPVTGDMVPAESYREGDRTVVTLDLPQSGSCFVVFHHGCADDKKPTSYKEIGSYRLDGDWTLAFPEGWGAPDTVQTGELKAWKDLEISVEGRAFSGTVAYTTMFEIDEKDQNTAYTLDLGRVDMIAVVSVNGKLLRVLWTPPYKLDITDAVTTGLNTLSVEVTSTWFNRLVYDAGQPEEKRKTWTLSGPVKEQPLRETGLLGPVTLMKSVVVE